jgi:hypothetical protein
VVAWTVCRYLSAPALTGSRVVGSAFFRLRIAAVDGSAGKILIADNYATTVGAGRTARRSLGSFIAVGADTAL